MPITSQNPITEYLGYVVYGGCAESRLPVGVISDSFECSAVSSSMPDSIKSILVCIEDKRFYEHRGIDPKGVIRAAYQNVKNLKIVEGGSSITQQLARNLLNDNRRTLWRKIREAAKAIQLERTYSKDEILKLYFDNVYFGKNLRGFRSAGLYYFGKEIEALSQLELLNLVAILRGPNYYVARPEKTRARVRSICDRLNLTPTDAPSFTTSREPVEFTRHGLQVIRNCVVPYVQTRINHPSRTIHSSISPPVQDFCRKWSAESKYPASVVVVNDAGVLGFASSYGCDFPFRSRSNVGSTLKPFLYCVLRESGVSRSTLFNSCSNQAGWPVREHQYIRPELTLEECLFYSNNNGFINAASLVGLDRILHALARTIGKDASEMTAASILGATRTGISLHELASCYNRFFGPHPVNPIRNECTEILNRSLEYKLRLRVENVFLKTGTTNRNRERYCVIKTPRETLAFLRNENPVDDPTKEGNFLQHVKSGLLAFLKMKEKASYTWSI